MLDAGRQQHKIRLQGIDAPEKDQPFGQRSKENLSRLVFNKDVRVEWVKLDRYKRIVGKVWVQPASCPTCPMTLDAGHAQITVGLAWWYRKYSTEQPPQDRGAYEFSDQEARAKRVGLWRDANPMPPWQWRRRVNRRFDSPRLQLVFSNLLNNAAQYQTENSPVTLGRMVNLRR